MTIYVDQMFLENFIMNFIILYIVSSFLGKQWKWYRLSIGASIGAIYVIASYIFNFYDKQLIFVKILLAIVMIITSFKLNSIKEFFKLFSVFLCVTLLIGGASIGLAFFANISMISEGGILYVEEFPIAMISLGVVFTIVIGKWMYIFLKSKIDMEELLYTIEIKLFDKRIITTAFLDSGHNAKERYTGYPVIILEKQKLKELIPDEIFEKLKVNDFEFDEKWKTRLRLIPVSTLSSLNDLLTGFKVDECVVHMKEEDKYINKLIVAGCDRNLDKEGRYFALMGNILK